MNNSDLAEREGFEPPIRLPVCRISSAVRSTTLPPLQTVAIGNNFVLGCKRGQRLLAPLYYRAAAADVALCSAARNASSTRVGHGSRRDQEPAGVSVSMAVEARLTPRLGRRIWARRGGGAYLNDTTTGSFVASNRISIFAVTGSKLAPLAAIPNR
jgi:hypothetical protein